MWFNQELPFAALIAGSVLGTLFLCYVFLIYRVPGYILRKVCLGVVGMGYLLCVFRFQYPWWPLILSGGLATSFIGVGLFKAGTFRGLGESLARCWFPIAATLAIIIGWVWLGNPWLAVVPILFLSWGDMCNWLIRTAIYRKAEVKEAWEWEETKGNWGNVGMLIACLVIATFFEPYFIGAIGAVVATLAERFTPPGRGLINADWTIITCSLATMTGVSYGCGYLSVT